jgi:hypothetical protein
VLFDCDLMIETTSESSWSNMVFTAFNPILNTLPELDYYRVVLDSACPVKAKYTVHVSYTSAVVSRWIIEVSLAVDPLCEVPSAMNIVYLIEITSAVHALCYLAVVLVSSTVFRVKP